MKILVLSDSHGVLEPMLRAVRQTEPELIVHLGDCYRDGEQLHRQFPGIPLEQVPGNCDFRPDAPTEKLLVLQGCRILLCHGHTYGVKQSLLRADLAARERGADLFLFGHTHRPLNDCSGKIRFLNPGSCGGIAPTCALIRLIGGVPDSGILSLLPE